MKIRIIDTFSELGVLHVSFQSPVGSGTALWSDSVPKAGEIVDMEFDLDEVFSWGKNMTHSSEKTPKISAIANVTYITAELSQSADEECAALNLRDSIILIELDGAIPLQSGFVELRAAKIHLYPTNI
ncbi:hypothetical protein NTD89_02330 [Pseudomonas sp. 14P_5.3_Bac1]|uniref:hypothetical protein n=1 Tax=Pseudomonas sp. 14P_5.3_Bac1 TaxID=2971622 RepID=UPI0021C59A8A|nr:hypothetical protein [Pseudomonas sp. 14P_5.3_Bac1]MCU1775849.1 hypothetical protein [Pseudomonas sp. 14P_5.3_Bac1]